MNTDTIYFDHAATTPLLPAALNAMLPYLREGFGNPSSLYGRGVVAKNAIRDARTTIAECISALPEEVYFTSGGTESDNWALMGVARAMRAKGRHIVVSSIEHHAILNWPQVLEEDGYEVTYLPVTSTGMIEESVLEAALRDDTILVSIMMANNEIGTIQKIPALSRIAHRHGVLFHTDAVQAVGHITVDVKRLGVDLLSASAHKFNGPTGCGFLYIKSGTRIAPFHIGGQQEQSLRAGTENVAGIVGMAVALAHNITIMGPTQRKLRAFAGRFKDLLIHYRKDIVFHGDSYNRLPGYISMSFPGVDGEALVHLLDLQGVCVSTGAACNSQSTEISHVLKAIGPPDDVARGTIRISFGEENTPNELLALADKLFSALEKLA